MAKPKPSEHWEVASVFDAAIDRETKAGKDAALEYRRERDIDALKLIEGQSPALFVLRPLNTRCVMRWLKKAMSAAELHEKAFRASVVCIRGYRGAHEDQERHDFVPARYEKARKDGTDVEMFDLWSDEELDRVHPSVLEEIGDVAAARAFFHPRIWPRFVLLDSSAQMLGTQDLRAELARATQTETSSG